MKEITLADVETAIKSIAATALKNEQYFCELDSYAGDADFGVSLASGFRVVEQEWNELDRSSIGTFLLKISMIITKQRRRLLGPDLGHRLHARRRALQGPHDDHARGSRQDADGGIEGIQKRGGAQLGDKTLLDALIPIRDIVREQRGQARCRCARRAAAGDASRERRDRAHEGSGSRNAAASNSRAIGAAARPIPASSRSRR